MRFIRDQRWRTTQPLVLSPATDAEKTLFLTHFCIELISRRSLVHILYMYICKSNLHPYIGHMHSHSSVYVTEVYSAHRWREVENQGSKRSKEYLPKPMRIVDSLCPTGPGARGWDGRMEESTHTWYLQRHRDDGGWGRGEHAGKTQEVSTGKHLEKILREYVGDRTLTWGDVCDECADE